MPAPTKTMGHIPFPAVSADGKTITIDALKLTDEGLSGDTFFDLFTNTDVSFDATTSTIEIQRDGAGTRCAWRIQWPFGRRSVYRRRCNHGHKRCHLYHRNPLHQTDHRSPSNETINTTEVDADGVTFTGSGNGFAYESSALITYTDATNRITVRNAGDTADITGVFSSLSVGDNIALSGSAGGYDDTYTITAVATDGSYIEVSRCKWHVKRGRRRHRRGRGTLSGFRRQRQHFFNGHTMPATANSATHRVDDNRSFEFDIQANDPAFEKAGPRHEG